MDKPESLLILRAVQFFSWSAISMPATLSVMYTVLPRDKRTMGVTMHACTPNTTPTASRNLSARQEFWQRQQSGRKQRGFQWLALSTNILNSCGFIHGMDRA